MNKESRRKMVGRSLEVIRGMIKEENPRKAFHLDGSSLPTLN
jgi:hypothetical protein